MSETAVCRQCRATKLKTEFRPVPKRDIGTCVACFNAYHRAWNMDPVNRAKRLATKKAKRAIMSREAKAAEGKLHRDNRERRDPWTCRLRRIRADKASFISVADLNNLWDKQAGICAISGLPLDRTTCQLDHEVPVSAGGSHTLVNLRWVTRDANYAKGTLSDTELVVLCRAILVHADQASDEAKSPGKYVTPTANPVPVFKEARRCTKPSRIGVTGLHGVSRLEGKFSANLQYKGTRTYLGIYATPEEAYAVVQAKRVELGLPPHPEPTSPTPEVG
jgi:hypothetical protein